MKKLIFCVTALAAFIAPAQLRMSTNGFTYQGILLDGNGAPVEGTKTITFTIYNESNGGSALWARTVTINAAADGLFNTELSDESGTAPSETPTNSLRRVIANRNGAQLYLGMEVDKSTGEIFPRQKMLPVPIAMHAEDAAGSSADEFIVQGTVKSREVSTGEIEADSITAKNISVTGAINGIGTIPEGGIILWSGNASDIPAGWALCDGKNDTPNLTGRFVLGDSGMSANTTGGNSEISLQVKHLPPHTHDIKYREYGYVSSRKDLDEVMSTRGTEWRKSRTTTSTGGGEKFSIMPPFYRLAYIMRLKTK